jgi:hypothetical protein
MRGKAGGHHLGDDLGNGVYEAYRPKVGNVLGPFLLGDKDNVCGIEPMEIVGAQVGELINYGQEVMLNDVPTIFEEGLIRLRRIDNFLCSMPHY